MLLTFYLIPTRSDKQIGPFKVYSVLGKLPRGSGWIERSAEAALLDTRSGSAFIKAAQR
jgi:hypothetical protein